MFEHDYNIIGKHATQLKFLVKEAKVFKDYIDVYMNGAIVGFLHGRTEPRDNSSQDRARIYADAFATNRRECDFIYRLIMLLDETAGMTPQQRIDRAFRDDSRPDKDEASKLIEEHMTLFHSYVSGGIEKLYEMFTSGATNKEDYINNTFDIITNFKQELEGIDYEGKLSKLINNN